MRKVDVSSLNGHVLTVFLAVYDEISVSRAALRLDISQSSVSHTLEKLRGLLGDELFQKAGRGIVPTATATRIAPQVRQILADMQALGDEGDYDPSRDRTPVVIAMKGSSMAIATNRIKNAIWAQQPDMSLSFRELGSWENLEEALHRQRIDLAITPRLGAFAVTLHQKKLYDDSSVIFYDPDVRGPVTTVEAYGAARHAVLDFGGSVKSSIELSLAQWGIHRNVVLRAPNPWVLADAIRGTDMIASLPASLTDRTFRGFASCPMPFQCNGFSFDLTWHIRHENAPRHIWIRNCVLNAFATWQGLSQAG